MRFDEKKHIAYEGQEFRIEWYVDEKGESQSLDYTEEMTRVHIGKLAHLFKVMGNIGKIHDETKFRNEGDKIYAFKPQPYRFLSFFAVGKKIIVTNGFYKKQDKLPISEKERSIKAMKDYLKRVKAGEYYE